jgi:hypothetical protein
VGWVAIVLVALLVVAVVWSTSGPDPGDEAEPPGVSEEPDVPEPDEPSPAPDPDEPESAPSEPDVLWTGDFDSSDWEEHFGVVESGTTNTQVLEEGPDGRDNVLEISFGEDGERWGMDYRHAFDELAIPELEVVHFSYDVYFPWGFEFIGDGKLGGLAGLADGVDPFDVSSGGNYDERSFSVRAMWKEDRGVVMYLYARQAAGRDFWDPQHYGFGIAESFVGPDGGTSDIFTPGQWHRIEHRVQMNTPGVPDGVYELWVDGHRGVHIEDVEYRTADQPDLRVNHLMSTWFFGGGSDQFPTRRNQAYTDNWVLAVPDDRTISYTASDPGESR